MARIIHRAEQEISANRTVKFEGHAYGAGVSFFLVDAAPGEGPDLHFHPYPETWIVRSGIARMEVGGKEVIARTGDIIVVEANTPHGFKNIGYGRLEITCIHPSDRIIQEWVEPPSDEPGRQAIQTRVAAIY